jgi:hypothetical protein
MKSLYILKGLSRKTGLKESVAIHATNEEEARINMSTTHTEVVLEKGPFKLSRFWQ